MQRRDVHAYLFGKQSKHMPSPYQYKSDSLLQYIWKDKQLYRTEFKLRHDSLAESLQQNVCGKYFNSPSTVDLIGYTSCGKWLHKTCVIYY